MNWSELRAMLLNGQGSVTDNRRRLSFPELLVEAESFGNSITAELPNENTVGIFGENSIDYLVALFGLLSCGCMPVPLNTRLTSAELQAVLRQTGARSYIRSDKLSIPEARICKTAPSPDTLPMTEIDQPSIVICSSGSEGKVKAAVLPVESFLRHALAVNEHLQVTESDHWLACLPFFHVGGLTIPFRCALASAAVTILPTADPEALNESIEANKITLISLVAASVEKLLDFRKDKPFPDYLRAIITGGGPVPDRLLERCPLVYKTYGMTESGSMLTCARPGCDDAERYSAGAALPETIIRVVDDDGKPCDVKREGNVLARGPGQFAGYVNDPDKTALTLSEGWLKTDDFGYLDERGNLHILARRKDLILSGGENIIPAEIERALKQHPQVRDAVVLPIQDEQWGQAPGAVVVSADSELSPELLTAFLRERIASYKLPRLFVFVKNLPTLPTGKIDLQAVRKLLEA